LYPAVALLLPTLLWSRNEFGKFEAPDLQPGNYDIAILSGALELVRKENIASGSTDIKITVPLVSTTGIVELPDGQPLTSSVKVIATPIGGGFDRSISIPAENKGKFSLTQLPPVLTVLRVESSGHMVGETEVDLSNRQDTIRIKISNQSVLHVKVVESTKGIPLPGVRVSVIENYGYLFRSRSIGTTNADGIVIDKHARVGKVDVVADNPPHDVTIIYTRVKAKSPNSVVMRLNGTATITGAISGSQERSAKDVEVYAEPFSPIPKGSVANYGGRFDQGAYRITVPAGKYVVHVSLRSPKFNESDSDKSTWKWKNRQSHYVTVKDRQTLKVDL